MSQTRVRMERLGIELPPAPRPAGHYQNALRVGDLLFIAGHGPLVQRDPQWRGRVPSEVSVRDAVDAARLTALNCVATAATELGDLDRVTQIVRVFGMINADPGFEDHITVLNGASTVLMEIFDDRGRHVRAAVGMSSLPMGIPVEIEMIMGVA